MPHTFRVVTHVEGDTTKVDHKLSTEIREVNSYYVAETMEQVWEAIELDRLDENIELIAIIQEHPVLAILP